MADNFSNPFLDQLARQAELQEQKEAEERRKRAEDAKAHQEKIDKEQRGWADRANDAWKAVKEVPKLVGHVADGAANSVTSGRLPEVIGGTIGLPVADLFTHKNDEASRERIKKGITDATKDAFNHNSGGIPIVPGVPVVVPGTGFSLNDALHTGAKAVKGIADATTQDVEKVVTTPAPAATVPKRLTPEQLIDERAADLAAQGKALTREQIQQQKDFIAAQRKELKAKQEEADERAKSGGPSLSEYEKKKQVADLEEKLSTVAKVGIDKLIKPESDTLKKENANSAETTKNAEKTTRSLAQQREMNETRFEINKYMGMGMGLGVRGQNATSIAGLSNIIDGDIKDHFKDGVDPSKTYEQHKAKRNERASFKDELEAFDKRMSALMTSPGTSPEMLKEIEKAYKELDKGAKELGRISKDQSDAFLAKDDTKKDSPEARKARTEAFDKVQSEMREKLGATDKTLAAMEKNGGKALAATDRPAVQDTKVAAVTSPVKPEDLKKAQEIFSGLAGQLAGISFNPNNAPTPLGPNGIAAGKAPQTRTEGRT